MANIGCDWQNMLIWRYMEASRKTDWPVACQSLHNPLILESNICAGDVFDTNMGRVFTLLQPGVDEIKHKCGSEPAAHLRTLLHKIRYAEDDAPFVGP